MEHYLEYAPTKRVTKEGILRRFPVGSFVKPVTSPWAAEFPGASLPRLIMGFQAVIMDHKWHVYTEGPNDSGTLTVYFLRSWSGYPVVAVKTQCVLDGNRMPILGAPARIIEITWEADERRYFLNDEVPTEESARKWVVDVCDWVFGVHVICNETDEADRCQQD